MQAWQLTFQWKGVPVVLITLIVLAGLVGFYRRLRGTVRPGRWRILVALRTLGLATLLILVFKPAIGFRTKLTAQSVPVILVDTSRSMQTCDAARRSRLDVIKSLLAENLDLLKQDPPARVVAFADRSILLGLDKIGVLKAEGQSTDITGALRTLDSSIPRETIQAVILLTDGNHRGRENPAEAVRALNRPVYGLGVGSANAAVAANLAIDLPDTPVRLAAQADNPISVAVRWQGAVKGNYDLTPAVNDKPAAAKTIAVTSPAGKRQIEVPFKPPAVGKTICTLRLATLTGEILSADNTREFHALALPEKITILIVEGQVRPEFKFLKQYLQSDPAVAFASFVQIRPGKFLVSSHVPNYQPKNLPTAKSEFDKFDLVILGNVSARTFTADQARWIKELIGEGKGLLLIPGEETAELGKTALADLLPVRLEAKAAWLDRPFLARSTVAGKAHPILKNLEAYFQPDSRSARAARFTDLVALGPPWPAASVLLEHPDSTPDHVLPVLAVRPVGKGQTALLASGSTWHWALNPDPTVAKTLYPAFWGQLIRHLANKNLTAKQPAALVVNLDTNAAQTGQPVRIRADVFDAEARAVTTSAVTVEVLKDDKVIDTVAMSPRQDHYQARRSIAVAGNYKLRARTTRAGADLTDVIPLAVYALDEELRQTALNKSLLDDVAAAGNTEKMSDPESLGSILRDLRQRYADRTAHETNLAEFRAFDHRVFLLVVFLAAISTEWFLRHRWRLR